MQIITVNNTKYYIDDLNSVLNLIEKEIGIEAYRACLSIFDDCEEPKSNSDEVLDVIEDIKHYLDSALCSVEELKDLL